MIAMAISFPCSFLDDMVFIFYGNTGEELVASFHLSNMNAYPDYRASNSTLTVNTVRGVPDQLHMRVRSPEIVELVMGRYGLVRK